MRSDGAVRLKNKITIPPRSEVVCEGIRDSKIIDSDSVFIKPFEVGVRGVLVAREVVNNKDEVPLRVMYFGEEKLELTANTVVGYDLALRETVLSETQCSTESSCAEIDSDLVDQISLDHLNMPDKIKMQDLLLSYKTFL